MGEYADMIIEGLVDSETGELIDGDAPGYPRRKHRRKPFAENQRLTCPVCKKRFRGEEGLAMHTKAKHA